jgi:hypothetical protein
VAETKALLIVDRQGWIGVIVPWALGKELVPNTLKAAPQVFDDLRNWWLLS